MDPILSGLNPPQLEAVTTTEGPLLVVAGAGSGKTRVLTRRIAYMIRNGVQPWRILAVTFTNKAAREMEERVAQLLERVGVTVPVRSLWISTFHSIASRLLRRYGTEIGVPQNFTIYDADDQKTLVKRIMKDMNLENDALHVRQAIHYLDAYRNGSLKALYPPYDTILEKYRTELATAQAVDFTGLLEKALELAPHVAHLWDYILIDEFQDTNHLQFEFIHRLASPHGNVCAVGDDDQSIYSWRGATPRFLIEFERQFSGAREVRLEQNYRSTGNIISAAGHLILHNTTRRPKKIWTEAPSGEPIYFNALDDERQEASWIVSRMLEHNARGVSLDEMAVLYRINAQSRPFEDSLRREGIPYTVVGGTKFYERAEIKDLVAYLRLALNARSDIDILRVLNKPKRGLGQAAVRRIQELAGERSLWHGLHRARDERRIGPKITEFVRLVEHASALAQKRPPEEVLGFILEETDWLGMRTSTDIESITRVENMNELLAAVTDYSEEARSSGEEPTLQGFLESIALVSAEDLAEDDEDTEKVWLMTVHAAKGLEFDVVFLPGWEEKLFPMEREDSTEDSLEEERRLAYVAMTRARRVLYITRARERMVYGRTLRTAPSRFLKELPRERIKILTRKKPAAHDPETLAEVASQARRRRKRSVKSAGYVGSSSDAPFRPGDVVQHRKFGMGRVVSVDGSGDGARVAVNFRGVGQKVIVASYLTAVDS